MDLLLTHGYFLAEDEHEKRIMKPYPPLGVLYLSAFLKSKGYDVGLFDSTFRTRQELFRYVRSHRPAIVGIYCNLMTKLNVLELIRFCKKEGLTVVLGGPEPAFYTNEFLDFGADVIVLGEGELTMRQLLEQIPVHGVNLLHQVPGIAFKDRMGAVVHTEARPVVKNLDDLPFPDRESIDLQTYISTWRKVHKLGAISLITARGCPYTCKWCSHAVYGFTHRRRSPKNVVDEVEHLIESYHPDLLWIADDVFTINHRWLFEYSREMKHRGLKIPFECISRADRVNDEVLRTMSELGCFRIWFGSESGSQRILDAMSREVTTREIASVTKIAQQYGIEVGLFVMLGYTGETIEDIEATIAHLKSTNADTFLTTVAYPIKGTSYYNEIESALKTDLSWEKRTERDFKVTGRYSDRFYWFAQRRMGNEVRYHRLSQNGSGKIIQRTSALTKAKIAHVGMELTKAWKS